ncbi:MAG: hypothetical protein HY303_11625 [Candidatus Wallbacteria bacterium]|nr:hypothetical protein [Candidatus Wallbacteria bacterium]
MALVGKASEPAVPLPGLRRVSSGSSRVRLWFDGPLRQEARLLLESPGRLSASFRVPSGVSDFVAPGLPAGTRFAGCLTGGERPLRFSASTLGATGAFEYTLELRPGARSHLTVDGCVWSLARTAQNKELTARDGRLVFAWTELAGEGEGVHALQSEDDGDTWEVPSEVYRSPVMVSLWEPRILPDRVRVTWSITASPREAWAMEQPFPSGAWTGPRRAVEPARPEQKPPGIDVLECESAVLGRAKAIASGAGGRLRVWVEENGRVSPPCTIPIEPGCDLRSYALIAGGGRFLIGMLSTAILEGRMELFESADGRQWRKIGWTENTFRGLGVPKNLRIALVGHRLVLLLTRGGTQLAAIRIPF